MKASEVLQECIEDIDAGRWICGDLHEKDLCKPNPKDMGCAVGLVSLNSGDTKTIRITKKDLPGWLSPDEKFQEMSINSEATGASCSVHSAEGIKAGMSFEVARYPKKSSPSYTKEAIDYLDRSIPEHVSQFASSRGGTSIEAKTTRVVEYNDGPINYSRGDRVNAAKEWFTEARDLALKEGN